MKRVTLLKRSFRQVCQKKVSLSREMTAPCVLFLLKMFHWDKTRRWVTVTLVILT